MQTSEVEEALLSLVVAEALSHAIRDDVGAEAVRHLRSTAGGDRGVLDVAGDRCGTFDLVDLHVRRQAADLLRRARCSDASR